MQTGHRTATTLLATLYTVSGALCWAGAAMPMDRGTPVALLWVLGAIGLGVGAGLWWSGRDVRPWVLHAAVALASVLVGVLAWQSATAVGIVGLGPALIAVGLYAAHFLPLPAARVHAGFALLSGSAGAWAAAPSDFLSPWITLIATAVVLVEVQARLARQLRTAAGTDPLTGLANRRAWEEEASRHLARAARSGEPLSFAVLDLDDFKEVNDRDGHGAGDALLRELTAGWSRRLRHADLLGRYGGDEFVLCLPATDEAAATELLGQLAATHPFTWTGGVATARSGDTLTSVLARADEQLYRRKRSGRTT
ncbi:GGDEF domain-containing protein [Blastococcus saxobsidens]|uniref:Diguanylate cyclase (GGDEF)-like protein n=1 Tax=Blastococcus saxobsidens TaxID=138336 RepID=A0A4Q7Y6G8_9ACTN|nr:GGDEF domain-containing protein [Blastococcus saxobsidens]RZU32562.1 diguanylate cyclase (GGDEF)-like protein [Blastococcus saxobsidens]